MLLSLFVFVPVTSILQEIGEKEIDVKAGSKRKLRTTAVLAVRADAGKLTPLLIFKYKPTVKGKAPPANGIERKFSVYKGKKVVAYPRGVVYAVDPKGWQA